jgi:hypothetical protein
MAIISDTILDTIDLLSDKEKIAILGALITIREDDDYKNEYFSMGVRNTKPRKAYEDGCNKIIELFKKPYTYQDRSIVD